MADTFSPKKRSWIMSRIKGRDTKPEKAVYGLLRRLGYKPHRNVKALPGRPDLVLNDEKKVIFINGCFWHGHKLCQRSRRPATNRKFWKAKIESNVRRDLRVKRQLRRSGWDVLVVWECRLKDGPKTTEKLIKFLDQ